MSEPPARAPDDGGEWRPLADQVAVNVKNFIDGVEALAQSGGDETVPLLLLEVSQILLAGAQLGASSDVILPGNWEPEVGDDPDLDALRTGLAGRLSAVDEYAEVFDPYKDTTCLPFRISDDIAAVVADLDTARTQSHGLVGMTHRMRAINGTLDIHSEKGGGTKIVAFLPLAA